MSLSHFAGIFPLGLMIMGAGVVWSQDYPKRPIRIVTVAIGGGSDFASRLIAPGLSAGLGQPVIVDNRNGAVLASEVASKATADGHTLLVQGAALWVFTLLQKAPYDPVRDFSPITQLTREVSLLVVHPSVAANSVKELIALAKAKPGVLNYSSTGVGGPAHLNAELFKSMAGVDILHVSYKGTAPGITALLGGQVQVMFNETGGVAAHVKSGKLKALAVTSATPSALFPGLPTIAASGLPGYELVGITGFHAPAKTPVAVISRLNQEIVRVLNQADVKEKFLNAGSETVASSPEQFAAVIKADMERKSKVIKDAGIKAD